MSLLLKVSSLLWSGLCHVLELLPCPFLILGTSGLEPMQGALDKS